MSAPVTQASATVHEFTTELIVRRRSAPAEGVVVLDLAHPQGEDLPRWEPGAHIDLLLSEKLTRQYSLCGDSGDPSVWRVGVLLDPASRGGSQYVHDNLQEGVTVRVRGPRNHFELVDAPRYRFVAGGIGITPIFAMLEEAERTGNDWTLLYGGRTRASMAFVNELVERYPDRVTVWPQDERGFLDLAALLKDPADDREPMRALARGGTSHRTVRGQGAHGRGGRRGAGPVRGGVPAYRGHVGDHVGHVHPGNP
jgi:ferredoxin-NADP reductase